MAEFSERQGYQQKKPIQFESMDEELRTSLWNVLHRNFWSKRKIGIERKLGMGGFLTDQKMKAVIDNLWTQHFKYSLDEIPRDYGEVMERIKSAWDKCAWYEVYDFIEFMTAHADFSGGGGIQNYISDCNDVMEAEQSAYRFVGNQIVPIIDVVEIQQVEDMLTSPHEVVRLQIQSALQKLSMKPEPDARNCVKEAICAVESAARMTLGVEGGTLGDLVPKLKDKFGIHPALAESLNKLYGWTCDIARHGRKDDDNLGVDEARFALVTCSAFANYLLRLGEREGTLKPPSV